jgi:hypothetical protein
VIWKREKGHEVTREEAAERLAAAATGGDSAPEKVPASTR